MHSVFSGNISLWFEEAPKSLKFFLSLYVMFKKKTACMEAKERYIQSEVMVSKNVCQFLKYGVFLLNFYVLFFSQA